MDVSIIPKDSLLHKWTNLLSTTEVPVSYQIAVGISLIGALIKRNLWIDQHATEGFGWNVYPNQSVMLIGPSGIGKDTAINYASKYIDELNLIPTIGGKTIEGVFYRLYHLGKPACAYIPAGELTAFFGNRDYQNGMVQEFTDLLSGNEKKDISNKGDLVAQGGKPKLIEQPTLTMHCGSTEEWLHKAMPDGSLEGGFLGRFLIVVENFGSKFIPLPKYVERSKAEIEWLKREKELWGSGVKRIIGIVNSKPQEMFILKEAQDYYTNWYCNRFKKFSKAVLPYANRSRDMVLRLGMLMATTRGHYNWMDEDDVAFGAKVMDEVAKRIDTVVLPPTLEAKCARAILAALPITPTLMLRTFGHTYGLRIIQQAEQWLIQSGQIKLVGKEYVRV